MLFGDGPKGNKFANAGVGENNIDSALHLGNGLVETIKVGQLGNVSLNSRNIAADCLHGFVEFLLAAAYDEDIGTLFSEELCRSQPNPFCPAGDDGGLAFELFRHCLSPLLLSWNSPTPMLHTRSLESERYLAEVIGQMKARGTKSSVCLSAFNISLRAPFECQEEVGRWESFLHGVDKAVRIFGFFEFFFKN